MIRVFELRTARRFLGAQRRSRFSSLVGVFSIAGVFIGTASLVVAMALLNGFEGQVRDRLIGRDSHLDLLASDASGLPDGDSLPDLVEKSDPRVVAAAPFLGGKAGISSGRAADGIVVMGIDPLRAPKVTDIVKYMNVGRLDLSMRTLDSGRIEHGIVMGYALASRLGLMVGDKATLVSLSSASALAGMGAPPRMERVVLTGIFASGLYEFDANMAFIGIPSAQRLYQTGHRISGIQVRVKDMWAAREVGQSLAAKVKLEPLDWLTKNAALMKWMRLEKVIVTVVLCLIILVAAFNIASSLVMGVLEKTREIGILRAMGTNSRSILRIFLFQGAYAGLIGSLSGISFGLGLCWIQARFQLIKLPGDIYFIDVLPVDIHWQDVVIVGVAANVICWLAALYPAWRASKLSPVAAIRQE
ncbi:MAG: hypothetical protein RL318_59 [Fibrobacterota bacterium]